MTTSGTVLTVYMAHRGALLSYASSIVGDRSSAEDVVQEAYLRFSSVADARPLDEPVGYLYRIVRNLALDCRRRTTREESVVEHPGDAPLLAAADSTPSPEATLLARDDIQRLMAAMAELPERTRLALEMRRFGDYKLREIADHLGVSVSLVHEIIADGLAHCRRRMQG
ncbi:sigma-70 family RNA polymerase sigma factor [Insolitispirillum peregrinum]|nr:sigma-70 family RNA polymerase sigma factor [Insolitispirillum peregrinum]